MTNQAGLHFALSQELVTNHDGEDSLRVDRIEREKARLRQFIERTVTPVWVSVALVVLSIVYAPFFSYRDYTFSWHPIFDYDYHHRNKGSEDFLAMEWGAIALLCSWWWLRKRSPGRSWAIPLATLGLITLAVIFPPTFTSEERWSFDVITGSGRIQMMWLGIEIFFLLVIGFLADYVKNLRASVSS